jgi:hypothetical protein
MQNQAKRWTVEIFLDEYGRHTDAVARLHTRDAQPISGTGRALRNPADPVIPEIGDEVAAARALADLAHRLLDAAIADIEAVSASS